MNAAHHARDPERIDELIGRSLRDDPGPAVRQIERDGLWEYVAARAWQSRVGGMLSHHLGQRQITMPVSAARQLDAYREHVAAANAYNALRVEPVLARLQAERISFLVLKGAALNATVYDDPSIRPMVDLDLLIHPEDAARADRVLRDAGCTPGAELVQQDFFPRYYYESEYFTPDSLPVKIDLHVRPFRPLRYARTVPDDALWDEPMTVEFGQLAVQIPGPQAMLIHLAVHAACHGLKEVRWLYDIQCWLDRFSDQIDVETLAQRCRQWKLELAVRRALEEVRRVFDSSNPFSSRAIERMAGRAGWFDRLALAQAPRDEDRPVTDVLVNCLCSPGLAFRLGYLKAVLCPDASHLGQLYSRRQVELGFRRNTRHHRV